MCLVQSVLRTPNGACLRAAAVQTAAVTSFVREHVVQRADSLQMLAVRHGVTVPCLKRVNNLMSDHALQSRLSLFIPGGTFLQQAGFCMVQQIVAARATVSCGEGSYVQLHHLDVSMVAVLHVFSHSGFPGYSLDWNRHWHPCVGCNPLPVCNTSN